MSNEEQETIEDIVADIRAQNQGLPEDSYALSPLVCDLLSLADRIDAAWKREREAGAEAATIISDAYGYDRTEKDACLIAAAPELYEALQSLVEYIDRECIPCGENACELLDAAHSALAKAAGESEAK